MTYTIEYSKEADRTLPKWKKSNPNLFKKATKILMDIMQHPRTGLGHPEALVGGNDVTYSRHITPSTASSTTSTTTASRCLWFKQRNTTTTSNPPS